MINMCDNAEVSYMVHIGLFALFENLDAKLRKNKQKTKRIIVFYEEKNSSINVWLPKRLFHFQPQFQCFCGIRRDGYTLVCTQANCPYHFVVGIDYHQLAALLKEGHPLIRH